MLTNKNKRFYLWSIGILIILNVSTILIVWIYFSRMGIHSKHNRNHNDRIVEFVKKELNLTNSQTLLYARMRVSHFQKVDSIMTGVQRTKDILMNKIFQRDPDSMQIDSLANEIGKSRTRIEEMTVYHFRELEQICTPEQKVKLRNLLGKFLRHRSNGKVHRSR